jgi:hypothetical protein
LVSNIDEYLQEKRNSCSADFVIQKSIRVLDENGKTNGILQRQVRSILKEMPAGL